MEYVREMFNAVYEWFIDADQPTWQAREWRHYVIVETSADEQYTQYDDLEDDGTDAIAKSVLSDN